MENGSEILSSNQSAQRINIVGKGDRLIWILSKKCD
jgi:hypothetical protein